MIDLAILQAGATAGMYKKPVEVLAQRIHNGPLPPEIRIAVIAGWQKAGLLPTSTIHEIVPVRDAR